MAIQSDETLVTKGDLKTLYIDKILPYLGGNMMMQTGVSDYYSTDEKVVGVWIDGKPLYQKTINFGTLPNNTKKAVAHGISNIEKVISIDGSAYGTTGGIFYAFTFPNVGTNNQYTYDIAIDITGANIDITTQTDRTFLTGIATIKYTKTTDTASSALTTPGCYDLNRPDLWPENKEIFFGNGLYGQRFTGKITAAGSTWIGTTLLSAETPAIHIVNWGGSYCYDTNSGAEIPVGSTWSNADNYNNGIDNMTINGNALVFGSVSGGTRNNAPYNIWITYTK